MALQGFPWVTGAITRSHKWKPLASGSLKFLRQNNDTLCRWRMPMNVRCGYLAFLGQKAGMVG